MLSVAYFGMTFWQAAAGIILGTGLGAVAHCLPVAPADLSLGVPQMVIGRLSVRLQGQCRALDADGDHRRRRLVRRPTASAPPSRSSTLFRYRAAAGPAAWWWLSQTALAFFGHNLVQAFERWAFPVLAVIFAIASVADHVQGGPGCAGRRGRRRRTGRIPADGGRHLRLCRGVDAVRCRLQPLPAQFASTPVRTGAVRRAAGLFLASSVAGHRRRGRRWHHRRRRGLGQPDRRRSPARCRAGWPAATLLAIAIGAVAANAINVYSAGDGLRHHRGQAAAPRRARDWPPWSFGVAGFLVAWWALADAAASYEAFLAAHRVLDRVPWLGVVFADQYLRRGHRVDGFLYDRTLYELAGAAVVPDRSGGVGAAVLQPGDVRRSRRPARVPELGDIRFFVGFVLAGGGYLVLCRSQDQAGAGGCVSPGEDARRRRRGGAKRVWPRAGFRSARPCSPPTVCCWAVGATGACRTTTRPCTARPMRSATPGRQRDYRSTVMVTTLSPCWYCSGLVRQFNIGAVVIGEAETFSGGHDWLAEHGVQVTRARRSALRDDDGGVHRRTSGTMERGHRSG